MKRFFNWQLHTQTNKSDLRMLQLTYCATFIKHKNVWTYANCARHVRFWSCFRTCHACTEYCSALSTNTCVCVLRCIATCVWLCVCCCKYTAIKAEALTLISLFCSATKSISISSGSNMRNWCMPSVATVLRLQSFTHRKYSRTGQQDMNAFRIV